MSRRSRWLWVSVIVLCAACVEGPARVPTVPTLDEPGPGEQRWLMVTAGRAHSCALDLTRAAYCWGSNGDGQVGITNAAVNCGGPTDSIPCAIAPVQVAAGARFLTISAGGSHTCGVRVDGSAYCWGANGSGQLGDDLPAGAYPVTPVDAPQFLTVDAGFDHNCGISTAREVYCWGANDHGQVGAPHSPRMRAHRVDIPGPFADVSAGQWRSCARTTSGVTYCWGRIWTHRDGALEFTRGVDVPEAVPDAPAFISLSVGTLTSCGIDATGFAYCWEANSNGQMGTGDADGSITPRRVRSLLEFTGISAGLIQSCATTASGMGFCWGDNTFGQLGIGPFTVTDRCGVQRLPCLVAPTPVFGRHRWIQISTGLGSHTCGVTTGHDIYCWGLGTSGQRGDGTRGVRESVPILVAPSR